MGGTTVKPGDVIDGKYRVDRVLGAGGMGIVVAARHLELDERVAIKFLLPEALGNEQAVTRFSREARAAAKVRSDHIARVRDVGKLQSGAPYIVMEYLQGHDLAEELAKHGRLSTPEVVDYLLQACEALAAAHVVGIIHRDLKPANLFLERRAGATWIKLLDFGISKVTLDQNLTQSAALLGSPRYMSPEQFSSSRSVDPRTDIWALGAIGYEALTGAMPFLGETLPELCHGILFDTPKPIEEVRPDVPEALVAIIARCMSKDQAARFENVGELASALAPLAEARGRISIEAVHRILESAHTAAPETRRSGAESGNDSSLSASGDLASAATDLDVASAPDGGTRGAWGTTSGNQPDRGKQKLALVGVAAAALVGLVLFQLVRRESTEPETRTGASTEPAALGTPKPEVPPAVPVPPHAPEPPAAPAVQAVLPTHAPSPSASTAASEVSRPVSTKPAAREDRANTPAPAKKSPPRPKKPTSSADALLDGRF